MTTAEDDEIGSCAVQAERDGVSRTTAHRWRSRASLPARVLGKDGRRYAARALTAAERDERDEAIRAAIDRGLTVRAIVAILGVSQGGVGRARHRSIRLAWIALRGTWGCQHGMDEMDVAATVDSEEPWDRPK